MIPHTSIMTYLLVGMLLAYAVGVAYLIRKFMGRKAERHGAETVSEIMAGKDVPCAVYPRFGRAQRAA